jgi:nicotinamidase-related amidase
MASSDRLTAAHSLLLVVDLQVKLLERIESRETLIANISRIIKAAQLLEIPTIATEQYPKGLGPSVPEVAAAIPHRPEKTVFHCCAVPQVFETIYAKGIRKVTLVGIEAHICVAQTALELLRMGLQVQILADAVASRHPFDGEIALRRLELAGAVVSTTETALLEWTESADHPKFKAISALVKEADLARSAPR